jgi:hypothetical protein
MGVPDIYRVGRIAEGRSMQRAIMASALATIRQTSPERMLRATWPRDEHAALLLKGAQTPTKTADYVSNDQIGAFRSIAPGSAALKQFDASVKPDLTGITTVRVPHVAQLPPRPVFVGEGAPAPAVRFTLSGTMLGPAKKMLVLSGVTAR